MTNATETEVTEKCVAGKVDQDVVLVEMSAQNTRPTLPLVSPGEGHRGKWRVLLSGGTPDHDQFR